MLYLIEVEQFELDDDTIILIERPIPCNDVYDAMRNRKLILYQKHMFYEVLVNECNVAMTDYISRPKINNKNYPRVDTPMFFDTFFRVSTDAITLSILLKSNIEGFAKSKLFTKYSCKIMKDPVLSNWFKTNTPYKDKSMLYKRMMNYTATLTAVYTYQNKPVLLKYLQDRSIDKTITTITQPTNPPDLFHISEQGEGVCFLRINRFDRINKPLSIHLETNCISTDRRKKLLEEVEVEENGKCKVPLTHDQLIRLLKIANRGNLNRMQYGHDGIPIPHTLYAEFHYRYSMRFEIEPWMTYEISQMGLQPHSNSIHEKIIKLFWDYTTGYVLEAAVNNIIEMYGQRVLIMKPMLGDRQIHNAFAMSYKVSEPNTTFKILNITIPERLHEWSKAYIMLVALFKHYDVPLPIINFNKPDETLSDYKLSMMLRMVGNTDPYPLILAPIGD